LVEKDTRDLHCEGGVQDHFLLDDLLQVLVDFVVPLK
jgi:hypothetical protein